MPMQMVGRPILRKQVRGFCILHVHPPKFTKCTCYQTSYSMYRPSAIAIANTLADVLFFPLFECLSSILWSTSCLDCIIQRLRFLHSISSTISHMSSCKDSSAHLAWCASISTQHSASPCSSYPTCRYFLIVDWQPSLLSHWQALNTRATSFPSLTWRDGYFGSLVFLVFNVS